MAVTKSYNKDEHTEVNIIVKKNKQSNKIEENRDTHTAKCDGIAAHTKGTPLLCHGLCHAHLWFMLLAYACCMCACERTYIVLTCTHTLTLLPVLMLWAYKCKRESVYISLHLHSHALTYANVLNKDASIFTFGVYILFVQVILPHPSWQWSNWFDQHCRACLKWKTPTKVMREKGGENK